jgi:hypothetical protein
MEVKKNVLIIIAVVVVLSIIIAMISGLDNIRLRGDLSSMEDELVTTKGNLDDNIAKLSDTTELLEKSNLFFNTYLTGLGTYYNATEIRNTADYKMEQAWIRYDSGHWSNSLAWYWDTTEWYDKARQKFAEAKSVFDSASKYAINGTYKDICDIYSDIMNTSSNAMVYAYEASEFYAAACEFYLDNDYASAYENFNNAELKMSYHDEEIAEIQDFQNELNTILAEIN